MKTVHVIIEGRVQGVFFRDYTRRQANQFGLQGWARNLPDGSVEVLISGDDKTVDAMIEWLHTGSPLSTVSSLTVDEVLSTEDFSGFEIRYHH